MKISGNSLIHILFQSTNINTNDIFYRLEIERVLPQLKIVVKSDNRDWRAHLEQIKTLRSNIETVSN